MTSVLDLDHVSVTRNHRTLLHDVSWSVDAADRWIVLGPNGAGKTTLLAVAAGNLYPTTGSATVLNEPLSSTNIFDVRSRVGFASTAQAARFPRDETVLDVVLTAAYGISGRWKERYEDVDIDRAHMMLRDWNVDRLAERTYGSLSDGEKKCVQIARSVMTDPELLLLDEPTANLDLGARERLLALLGEYAKTVGTPALVIVTHRVEDIPTGFDHALIVDDGTIQAQGAIDDILTSQLLSRTFNIPLSVTQDHGRYVSHANLV